MAAWFGLCGFRFARLPCCTLGMAFGIDLMVAVVWCAGDLGGFEVRGLGFENLNACLFFWNSRCRLCFVTVGICICMVRDRGCPSNILGRKLWGVLGSGKAMGVSGGT